MTTARTILIALALWAGVLAGIPRAMHHQWAPTSLILGALMLLVWLGLGVLARERWKEARWVVLVFMAGTCALGGYHYGAYAGWERFVHRLPINGQALDVVGEVPKGMGATGAIVHIDTVNGRARPKARVWVTDPRLLGDIPSGQRVRMRIRLKEPEGDFGAWLATQGVFATAKSIGFDQPIRAPRHPSTDSIILPASLPWYWASAHYVRTALYRVVNASDLPDNDAGLLLGLVIGDTSRMAEDMNTNFLQAGLTHLVAVSGSNVAFIMSIVMGLCWLLGLPKRLALVVTIGGVIWFAMLVNFDASVNRASAMAIIVLLAYLTGRLPDIIQALALTAIASLLVDPYMVASLGFQLSASATLAVILSSRGITNLWDSYLGEQVQLLFVHTTLADLSPAVQQRLSVGAFGGLSMLAMTIGAHIATLPILLAHGLPISYAAPFANMLAIPVASLGAALAQVLAIVAIFWEGGARMLVPVVHPLLHILLTIADVMGNPYMAYVTKLLTFAILFALAVVGIWWSVRRVLLPALARRLGPPDVEEHAPGQPKDHAMEHRGGSSTPSKRDIKRAISSLSDPPPDLAYLMDGGAGRDGIGRDGSGHHASAHDGIGRNGSANDGSAHDASAHDGSGRDASQRRRLRAGDALDDTANVPLPAHRQPKPTAARTQLLLSRARFLGLALGAGLAVALGVVRFIPSKRPSGATLTVVDVGQGDCIMIGDPKAGWLMIDTGPDNGQALAYLRANSITRLAGILVTHDHYDHMGALTQLVKHVQVDTILTGYEGCSDPGTSTTTPTITLAKRLGVPLVSLSAGQAFDLGGFRFTVLNPMVEFPNQDPNNASVVLLCTTPSGMRVLLTGDAEAESQWRMMQHPDNLRCDLLKVPHHGGHTNARSFIKTTQASHAVISCGRHNDYGHPDPRVMEDLADMVVRRTDLEGNCIYLV